MKESPQAFRAFTLYRDMGPDRSLEGLYRDHADTVPKPPTLKVWSAEHHWVDRARAHDQAIADAAAEADKAARLAEMEKRRQDRLKVAAATRGKGVAALQKMTPEALADQPSAVVKMLDYADRTERLDSGEATERIDVSILSDDQLLARLAIIREIRAAAEEPGRT